MPLRQSGIYLVPHAQLGADSVPSHLVCRPRRAGRPRAADATRVRARRSDDAASGAFGRSGRPTHRCSPRSASGRRPRPRSPRPSRRLETPSAPQLPAGVRNPHHDRHRPSAVDQIHAVATGWDAASGVGLPASTPRSSASPAAGLISGRCPRLTAPTTCCSLGILCDARAHVARGHLCAGSPAPGLAPDSGELV